MFNRLGHAAGLALVIAFLSSPAFAQGGSAVINGTIYDQAKAVLPGVTITVTNEATGITREAVSGPEGQFVVPTLVPGRTRCARSSPGSRRRHGAGSCCSSARS